MFVLCKASPRVNTFFMEHCNLRPAPTRWSDQFPKIAHTQLSEMSSPLKVIASAQVLGAIQHPDALASDIETKHVFDCLKLSMDKGFKNQG